MTVDFNKYTFHTEMDVRDYEVDIEGIVNHAVYLNYMEHTRHLFCREAGFPFNEMHDRGIDPVAARIEIDYRTPLRMTDRFVSCLDIGREGPLFVFDQWIYRADGVLAAHGRVKIATLRDGRLTRGEDLMPVFEKYLK